MLRINDVARPFYHHPLVKGSKRASFPMWKKKPEKLQRPSLQRASCGPC